MDLEEIKKRAIRSIVALTGRTIFLQATGLVTFFLLGIFLSPSAVGVFIVVSALVRIFTIFTDLGLGAALIQKKEDLDKEDLETAFTLGEILVVTVVITGFLLTPLISRFANLDSQGTFLYQVLLITLLISSLKVLPSILLERKLAFETQTIPQIVEALVFNFLVVFLAYKGFGVISYAWAILASALIGLPVYYLVSPWKISLGLSKDKIKHLLSFGIAYQGKNVLAVVKDDLLTFFLTGFVGTIGIGYWGWAQRWAYSPFRLIVDSVTKVTFPAYSRIQYDREILRTGIEKSLFAVSFVLFPVLTAMAFLISPFMQIIPKYVKWEPALVSFYFLCAGAAISALSNILINALDATGRVKTTLGLMGVWIVLTWFLTLALVAKFGFTGISMASFLVSLTIVLTVYLTKRVIKFSFLGSIYQPVIGCLGAGLGLYFLKLPLILIFPVGVIIYLLILIILARKELMTNMVIIFKAYKND